MPCCRHSVCIPYQGYIITSCLLSLFYDRDIEFGVQEGRGFKLRRISAKMDSTRKKQTSSDEEWEKRVGNFPASFYLSLFCEDVFTPAAGSALSKHQHPVQHTFREAIL